MTNFILIVWITNTKITNVDKISLETNRQVPGDNDQEAGHHNNTSNEHRQGSGSKVVVHEQLEEKEML